MGDFKLECIVEKSDVILIEILESCDVILREVLDIVESEFYVLFIKRVLYFYKLEK